MKKKIDKHKILTDLEDIRRELSKMITISLLAGGMPDRLLAVEKKIDEIKASITEA